MKLFGIKLAAAACGAVMLIAGLANAQQPANLAGMPALKGVYFRTGATWTSLPYTLLWPYAKNEWKWWLSVGRPDYMAEIPGEHAAIQVTDGQPTFYVRGLTSAMGPKLVQFGTRHDFRRVKMPYTAQFEPRVPFDSKALRDIEVAQVAPNVVSVRPRAPLTPGEYAVVATATRDLQRLYMGFDFRVGR
jgi:hypothetical protein